MRSDQEQGHVGFVQNLLRKQDFYAGGLMVLFGLGMAVLGPGYDLGTLMHMGPGFMPTALGIVLLLVGLAIMVSAAMLPAGEGEGILPAQPEWFAWGCILASPFAFILFGSFFGLAPATFACVFVAAMGDRTMTYLQAVAVSLVITIFGVGLFHYVLQIPMPVFKWSGL